MRLALLVPAPLTTLSGGYAYDRRMIDGLRKAGHVVDVIELAGRHPLVDDTATAAARAAWQTLPTDAVPVIDGLALPAFEPLADALATRRAVGLIHHPTALETGHSVDERDRLRAVEQHLLPLLAKVIVTSAPTADQLATEFGVDGKRIAIVVPGTEDAPRSLWSSASAEPGGRCVILSIGTLVPRKGHDVLLRALGRLPDLDWHLSIVGSPDRDPAHARTLQALADELGVAQRVGFAGEVDAPALQALWRGAHLFALTTYWEGYGMAVAEALKRGLPVAVTSGGAAAVLVTPDTGVVCAPGDDSGLSKALRRLIFDSGLRRDMAEHAWQLGRTLPTWDSQARAFADALTQDNPPA
jgi:glycosyltransferase involved in cell wall biosynthesis